MDNNTDDIETLKEVNFHLFNHNKQLLERVEKMEKALNKVITISLEGLDDE